MRAKFEIKRRCEVCGTIFMAPTLESRYCCRHCTDVAYKQRKAFKAKQERMRKLADNVEEARNFISVSEAVAMFNISRITLYKYIREGKITSAVNIGKRLTRMNKEELQGLFEQRDLSPEAKKPPRLYDMEPENCYTIGEISKKFRIDDSTVWAHIRKYSIPTRQIGNYVYAPKVEIDNLYKSVE